MPLKNQDNLTFRYSGFLQNVDICITSSIEATGYCVSCEANLKLPILKKNFTTWTLFKDTLLEWQTHSPVAEVGALAKTVERPQYSDSAIDPIGFFLKIHRGEWSGKSVKLVLGAKEVQLDVAVENGAVVVSRSDKNQKIIIVMGSAGIVRLEVPLPIIGSLKINRVDA